MIKILASLKLTAWIGGIAGGWIIHIGKLLSQFNFNNITFWEIIDIKLRIIV
jgi:hypothetical protein